MVSLSAPLWTEPRPAAAPRPRLSVALAAPYPPRRCGIGAYARSLAAALADQGLEVCVLAEQGARAGRDGPVRVVESFSRGGAWQRSIAREAREAGVDLVHFQHAPDVFGMDARLPELCRALRSAGVASVVTLHTVHTRRSAWLERRPGAFRFYRALGEAADALVVHQRAVSAEVLERLAPKEKIAVVPHGTALSPGLDRERARRRLGIGAGARLVVCAGFIHLQKNLELPLRAFARVRARVPDAELVIAGSIQNPAWYNRLYARYLRRLAERPALGGAARLDERFLPDAELVELLAAADLALFPYRQAYGSASGALHLALATGTPALCSRSPKFAEMAGALGERAVLSTLSERAWADRVIELLTAPDLLAELRDRADAYARRTSWPEIAARTAALYARVAGRG